MWSVAVYINLISTCLQLHGQHVQINKINKALGRDLSDKFLQNSESGDDSTCVYSLTDESR